MYCGPIVLSNYVVDWSILDFFGYYTALLAVLCRLGRYLFLQFIVPGSLCGQPVFAAHAYAMLNEAGK